MTSDRHQQLLGCAVNSMLNALAPAAPRRLRGGATATPTALNHVAIIHLSVMVRQPLLGGLTEAVARLRSQPILFPRRRWRSPPPSSVPDSLHLLRVCQTFCGGPFVGW